MCMVTGAWSDVGNSLCNLRHIYHSSLTLFDSSRIVKDAETIYVRHECFDKRDRWLEGGRVAFGHEHSGQGAGGAERASVCLESNKTHSAFPAGRPSRPLP